MKFVDPALVAQKVIQGVYQGVTTVELDNLAAETTAYLTVTLSNRRPSILIMQSWLLALRFPICTKRPIKFSPR